MKVATVQYKPVFSDVTGNLRALALLVIRGAEQGAKLIVLPELALSGYSMMRRSDAEPMAEYLQVHAGKVNTSMNLFHTLARKYQVCIVWGLIEKDLGTGKLYNSQVMMCPDGNFESYRKINFFGNDFLWASEGRSNPPIRNITVDGKSNKVGLLICRDVRDKKDSSWTSFYESGDADIVCLSANWGRGGFPATAWIEFAQDNNTTLVVSNRYGTEVHNDFGHGGIGIIRPSGEVVCDGLEWDQPCIVYAEV